MYAYYLFLQVVHDPVGDQKWHTPLPADTQLKSPQQSPLISQEAEPEPETQPAKLRKAMPRSMKINQEQKVSQSAEVNHIAPLPQLTQSMKPMPKSAKARRVLRLSQPSEPVKPMPKSPTDKPMLRSPTDNPMPKSPTAKERLESRKLIKSHSTLPTKTYPILLRAKRTLESPPSTKPQLRLISKPMPKSEKARKNLESPAPTEPQQVQPIKPMPKSVKDKKKKQLSPEPQELQEDLLEEAVCECPSTEDLTSIQLDHDYASKLSEPRMCEKFCSMEVMEVIQTNIFLQNIFVCIFFPINVNHAIFKILFCRK